MVPPFRVFLWVSFQAVWTTIGSTSTSLRLYFDNILALLQHCYNSISVQLRLHFGPMFGTSLALHQLFVSCLVAQFGTNLIHHVSLYYSSCQQCDRVKLFRPNYSVKIISSKPFWHKGSIRHDLNVDNWRIQAIQFKEEDYVCYSLKFSGLTPVVAVSRGFQVGNKGLQEKLTVKVRPIV